MVPVRRGRAEPRCATIRTARPIAHAVGYVGEVNEVAAGEDRRRLDPAGRHRREDGHRARVRRGPPGGPPRMAAADRQQPRPSVRRDSQQGREPGGRSAAASDDRQAAPAQAGRIARPTRSASGHLHGPANTGEVLVGPRVDSRLRSRTCFTAPVSRTRRWTATDQRPAPSPATTGRSRRSTRRARRSRCSMSIVGLETGAITPQTDGRRARAPDRSTTGVHVLEEGRPRDGRTSTQALVHSCNVFYYLLGKKVGIDAISEVRQDVRHRGAVRHRHSGAEPREPCPPRNGRSKIHKEQW